MLEERRPETAAVTSADLTARPTASAYRDPVTWATAACVFGAYVTLSLYRLWQRTPSSWDLGIYTEYVKQFANLRAPIVDVRGAGFNLLGDHFQVIVAVIAPFFRVFPSVDTLLVAQALLTAVSVFPVTTAATSLLGRGAGRTIGFAFGFSWGLQQMIDFDFHEIAFAVPLLAFSLSALVRGRTRAAVLWAMPLVFVKEDQGFTVAAIGLLMALAGQRRFGMGRGSVSAGLFLAMWGLGWSLLAITVIIPHFNTHHQYIYWDLGGVVGSGSGSSFSATGLVAQMFHSWPTKLETVVMLVLPTAFIALGSPVALTVLPSLGLRFLATNAFYWETNWHYNATAMPILFIAAAEVMARWRGVERTAGEPGDVRDVGALWTWTRIAAARHGAAMMAAITVALAFQFPISNIWHASTYQMSPLVAADNAAMAQVPDGATVQTTLGLLAPLSARTDTFWIGNPNNPATQYIVFDGQQSGYTPVPSDVPAFIKELFPKTGYVQIFVDDQVYVFRRA
jgi:uncharacterized membrane protein